LVPNLQERLFWLKKVQVDAVRFIANIKGRKDVESAMNKKILAKEEQHLALSSAHDDLLNKPTNNTIYRLDLKQGDSQISGCQQC